MATKPQLAVGLDVGRAAAQEAGGLQRVRGDHGGALTRRPLAQQVLQAAVGGDGM